MEKKHPISISITQRGLEDAALLKNINKVGVEQTFKEILKKHKESVYYLILKMVSAPEDAEDLTLEVFAKAYHNLDKYNPEFAFSTWLYRMASNHCIDFLRKKRLPTQQIDEQNEGTEGESFSVVIKDDANTPEEEMIQKQKSALVKKAISKLPPKYAEMIELRYFEELSYEEIATRINAPVGTVKAQINRAKIMFEKVVSVFKDTYMEDMI